MTTKTVNEKKPFLPRGRSRGAAVCTATEQNNYSRNENGKRVNNANRKIRSNKYDGFHEGKIRFARYDGFSGT